jgi:hypothetical protein
MAYDAVQFGRNVSKFRRNLLAEFPKERRYRTGWPSCIAVRSYPGGTRFESWMGYLLS